MNDNITPYVRYIGADDKDLDLFESQYVVPQGISYNSYVITDEKIAVMDTIDQRKTEEWTVRLEEALEGRTPDYLIVQHMEPDHAANIGWFAEKYPEATILAGINDSSDNVLYIKDKGVLKTVRFDYRGSDEQTWSATIYRLEDYDKLPDTVLDEYAKYRVYHPDFNYSEVYRVETKDGIYYGLKSATTSLTVYFKA